MIPSRTAAVAGAAAAVEIEEDLNEEDDEGDVETALAEAKPSSIATETPVADVTFTWEGQPIREEAGRAFYK